MGYYPLFVEMNRRPSVVIGGGAVAERKVAGLLAAGAIVTVISPVLTEGLQELVRKGAIGHMARKYEAGDLKGYELGFVATDDGEANRAVYEEARSRRAWINCADDPAHCDFILPAVIRRGDLAVAVSTGGGSPALSRFIREDLERHFGSEYEALAALAAEVRKELRERSIAPDYATWRKALTGDLRELVRQGEWARAKNCLLQELGVAV